MTRKILIIVLAVYTCGELCRGWGTAMTFPWLHWGTSFGVLFGLVLGLWLAAGVKK